MAKRTSKTKKRWIPEHAAMVLAQAERNGLSDRAFAKTEGIDPQRLWWWRKRLARTGTKGDAFVEVAMRQPAAPKVVSRVEILLVNGRVVAVPVDHEALGRLLDAVEGRGC